MEECPICCEAFNKSTRKTVECAKCQHLACTACTKQYLETLDADARCMNCGHGYDRRFLCDNLTVAWVTGDYKKRREQLLYERELARLPESQILVENYRTAEKLKQQLLEEREEKRRIQARLQEIERTRWNVQHRVQRMTASQFTNDGTTGGSGTTRKGFVCACPAAECRGFLNSGYHCGVCDRFSCPQCRDVIGLSRDAPHECDPNALETIALIRNDTRPCPSCGEGIYKVSGCDQMWCITCHTAFSWKTGRVVSGTVHNPHYFEYMRTRGELPRQPGDEPCGGLPDPDQLERAFGGYVRNGSKDDVLPNARKRALVYYLREIVHARHHILQNQLVVVDDPNADLRRKYLMSEIDADAFKKKLQQREKSREKTMAVRQVYELLCDASRDILGATPLDVTTALASCQQLEEYVLAAFQELSKRFSCTITRGFESTESLLARGLYWAKDQYAMGKRAKRRRLALEAELEMDFLDDDILEIQVVGDDA